jgi:S1-C subfamily serine protease
VLAIGNPFGVGQTVTNGIVSALARTDAGITDYASFIQTDAAINPGNSGGPLVDMDGDLIGLNTAIFSRTGQSTGVGFAIPATIVRQVVDSALGGRQTVERPWLGARTQEVTRDLAPSLGLPGAQGVIISQIYPGGPADRAGLREGDVLLAVDGQPVNDVGSVTYRIGVRKPGDTVALRIRREGAERQLTLRSAIPPRTEADQRTLTGLLGGATVANFSPALAEERGLDPFTSGVVVLDAGTGYARQRAGIATGDIIVNVNGAAVRTTAELEAALSAQVPRWQVTIQRGGQLIQATFFNRGGF